jgi:hypothetical protein
MTKKTTFNNGYFRPDLFPTKNAPIATAINAITTAATISSVVSDEVGCCDCEDEDDPGEVLDVGVDNDIVGEG